MTDAGNFKGNTGVSAFLNADGAEAKSRAAVSLFEQAVQSGQRLAALDFAKTIWGDDAAKNLAKNQDYMKNILEAADAISSKQLVSQADVDRAVMLQNKYDAAVTILEQRWHPVQDALTSLGMKMREIWIDIVSEIAKVVDYVTTLAVKIYDAMSPILNVIAAIDKLALKAAVLGSGTVALDLAKSYFGAGESQQDRQMDAAKANLASQLGNPANVARAQSDAVSTSYRVRKDLSVDTNKKQYDEASDAIDRAQESLLKYEKTTLAAAQSVGATAGEIERLKAMALLEAAAEKEGIPLTDARTKGFADLARRAGEAAQALAKARVANDIQYNRQTALLSPDDVQIASQLRNIYPNVADALSSVEAQAIRANNTLREMNDTGRSFAEGFGSDVLNQVRSGASAWSAFQTAGLNALNRIADKLMQMAVDNLWAKAFGGSGGLGLGNLFGSGGSPTWSSGLGAGTGGLSFPMFAGGTNFAPGGWAIVGEEGPELVNLPKGASVTPNKQTMAALNGGGDTNVPINISIDATGADSAGLARVQAQVALLKASLPATVVQEVRKAKSARML